MKKILIGAAIILTTTIVAQDSTVKKGNLTISGSVDAYYRTFSPSAKSTGTFILGATYHF